jgi:DNA topoisomerase-1
VARRGGWTRLGRSPRFRYVDSRGDPVHGEGQLERIRGLVIPPAWRDVWISPNPSAKLQATGVDKAGRRQYLYHESYRAAQEQAKFDRLVHFGELLPQLRRRMNAHVDLGPYERDWACAVAVTLVNRAWFRVGSDRYARESRTYGITTLAKRHASVRGSRVTFRFHAKHRVLVRTTVVDEDLAVAVRALLDLPGGSRLFRFERDGEPVKVTGPLLNEYIAEHLSPGYTAKDFRTWGGTLAAAIALAEHGPPASEAEERRVLAAVMRKVGAELGNTASVARSAYVSPAVIEQWREGRTLEDFRVGGGRLVAGRQRGLLPEEKALLSLLRSWRVRRSQARRPASRRRARRTRSPRR